MEPANNHSLVKAGKNMQINKPNSNTSTVGTQLPSKKKPKLPKLLTGWLGIVGIILLLSALAAYAVFGYIPNQPENVYRSGLSSVGEGLQFLVEQQLPEDIDQTTTYNGQITVKYDFDVSDLLEEDDADKKIIDACLGTATNDINQIRAEFSGSFNLLSEEAVLDNTIFNFDLSFNDKPSLGVEAKVLNVSNKESLPRLYFYLDETGCAKALAELAYSDTDYEESTQKSLIDDLLGNWWSLDFQQLVDRDLITDEEIEDFRQQLNQENQVTQEDYEEAVLILTNTLQEYIFTSNTEKMVFQMEQLLDNDAEYEGTPSKKYSTTTNRDNALAFATTLHNKFAQSQIVQKLAPDEEIAEPLTDEEIEELQEEIDDWIKDTKVEIWVDSKTKILRNMRFTDQNSFSSSLGTYVDLGFSTGDNRQSIEVAFKVTSFSEYNQCESPLYSGSPSDFEAVNAQADCPYEFTILDCQQDENKAICEDEDAQTRTSEEGSEKCESVYESSFSFDEFTGDEEEYDELDWDFEKEEDAYSDCLQDYQTLVGKSFKTDAEPESIASAIYKAQPQDNKVGFEFIFEMLQEELTIEAEVEFIGQNDAAAITAPEKHKSILDFYDRHYLLREELYQADIETL